MFVPQEAAAPISYETAVQYLALSIGLGALLTLVTIWANQKVGPLLQKAQIDPTGENTVTPVRRYPPASFHDLINSVLNASNVLFLCFGMSGIMILVNNNLARAFAIGAAIALVRFKIKLDSYGLGATLFFAVVVGMACGVGQVETAIAIAGAFSIIQVLLVQTMVYFAKRPEIEEENRRLAEALAKSEPLPRVTNLATATENAN